LIIAGIIILQAITSSEEIRKMVVIEYVTATIYAWLLIYYTAKPAYSIADLLQAKLMAVPFIFMTLPPATG